MKGGIEGNKGNTKKYLGKQNANYRHGMKGTKFWSVWSHMKTRCSNKNAFAYEHYGGRGIKVCAEWHNFQGFYDDMHPTYKEGLTLERIDVNGDYFKENCTWATRKEQTNNRRVTLFVSIKDKQFKLKEVSEVTGIKYITLYDRIYRQKMTPEKAVGAQFIGSLLN